MRGRSLRSSGLPLRLSWINSGRVELESTASDHSTISCCRLVAIASVRHSTCTLASTGRRSTMFQPGASWARVENSVPDVADQAISAEAIHPV